MTEPAGEPNVFRLTAMYADLVPQDLNDGGDSPQGQPTVPTIA